MEKKEIQENDIKAEDESQFVVQENHVQLEHEKPKSRSHSPPKEEQKEVKKEPA